MNNLFFIIVVSIFFAAGCVGFPLEHNFYDPLYNKGLVDSAQAKSKTLLYSLYELANESRPQKEKIVKVSKIKQGENEQKVKAFQVSDIHFDFLKMAIRYERLATVSVPQEKEARLLFINEVKEKLADDARQFKKEHAEHQDFSVLEEMLTTQFKSDIASIARDDFDANHWTVMQNHVLERRFKHVLHHSTEVGESVIKPEELKLTPHQGKTENGVIDLSSPNSN